MPTSTTHGPVKAVAAIFTGRVFGDHVTDDDRGFVPVPREVWDGHQATDHDILEEVFTAYNIGPYVAPYSMSVGDEVGIWRTTGIRRWRCEPTGGWTLVHP